MRYICMRQVKYLGLLRSLWSVTKFLCKVKSNLKTLLWAEKIPNMPSAPKVVIALNVIERLKSLKGEARGVLFGQCHDGTVFVIGFIVSQTESECFDPDLLLSIPSGIEVCGAFTTLPDVDEANIIFSKNFGCVKTPILLTSVQGDVKSHVLLNGTVSRSSFNTVNDTQLASLFLYFRTIAELPITFERTAEGIKHSLEELKKKVLSEAVAFRLTSKSVFLTGAASGKIFCHSGITGDHQIKDLIDSDTERSNKEYVIETARIHVKKTKELDQEKKQSIAPHICHVRCSSETFHLLLKVDSLALLHRNVKVGTLFSSLLRSFCHGLKLVEKNLTRQISRGITEKMSDPQIHHFFPSGSNHFVTVIYPKHCSDAVLKYQREQLHQSFGFPIDQPLFRRSQTYKFTENKSSNSPLLNPHEGLNSGVKGGQASLVKGQYGYHHYMQDRFDDNGWGCAYRSLQTIVSWFRLQGFTEAKVPTHKEIQECLVKIGDKPASFIGSRQWIGSTEVSFVLETLLGVTCKILTASTGEEVGSLGSELSYHFQSHGTPIMIGGGVLAHTIIGVDYNRSTGDIKFLILDPHYTGGEDLSVITGKGWVGWKDVKFWTKNAFYNLCLPLRPIGDI